MDRDPPASTNSLSRREFIHRSSRSVGMGWLAANLPLVLSTANLACQAKSENAPFVVLSAEEAEITDAITSMIIPTDDSPGAHEAGVVYFIDLALDSFAAPLLGMIRDGLETVRQRVVSINSSGDFHGLSESEKAAIMDEIDSTVFFAQIHFLTMAGMFSDPRHGGNKNKIGWQLLGFEDRHVWQYPFGYYDANQIESED